MTGPRPYSPDNPFAAPDFRDVTGGSSTSAPRYRPDNPFSPTVKVSRETFGEVAGTMQVAPQPVNDTGLTGTAGEMARTVAGAAKAIALPVKGEVGRRLVSAGGHFLTNTAEGGSLAPAALQGMIRAALASRDPAYAAQHVGDDFGGASDPRVMATKEAYRTAVNDPMDRALGITPLSNRPDVQPFDMAAQFAAPMLAERGAALAGNLAFRAGSGGVTRDVAAGLRGPLTTDPPPVAPEVPPEVRFPPEKAAVSRVLEKQRNWDATGRAAFVAGEGPGFGGEVPRAMTETGAPTAETVRALSDQPETIRAAAIKSHEDGSVFEGTDHGDARNVMQETYHEVTGKYVPIGGFEDGFVTSSGRFVTRDEAKAIASRARQVTDAAPGSPGAPNELHSSNIAPSVKALSPDNPFSLRSVANERGAGKVPLVSGLTGAGVGGAGGAATGSQIGSTPEEKRRNAIIGGVLGAAGGAVLGAKGGQMVEGMNERGAAPMAPEAPPAKLADVKLKGEPLQGPLRKPEENTVGRLALPEALSEQVRGIAREFTGPGYESFGQVKRKAQSLLKSNDIPIDFTRANRAEVLGAAALLRQNTEEAGRIAQRLADPKLADVERAALEGQMAQLDQTSRTLFNSITSAKTEQARDLAANRIIANLSNTPEHWQYRAQKIAERPLGDAENATIRKLLDEGKRAEALRYIGTLKPTTMQERLLSLWKAMLLTNPRTHAANTASNIVFGMTEEIARNPAAFADWVATKIIGGDRTKTPTSMAILKASADGAAKGLAQMPNRLKGLPTGRALSEGVIPHEAQWGHPILTTLFNAPFRFLEAADAPFFESALRGSLAEQATILAKSEGAKGPAAARRVAALIDAPTDEMVGRALHDAAVRTYKDQTAVGNLLQSVQKNFPVAGNIVMPFTKTPGAVATRFAEYTPYGFFKSARLYKQAIAEAVDGLPNPRLKQAAAENFGRATVGLGPIALGALLYKQGKASGQVDKGDKSARDTHYLLGIPDDAFKIGGQWVEPNRLGPQGMLLSLGAVMAQQAEKNDQTPLGAVGGAAFAGVRTVTDQPFLTGVQSLLQAREGADNATKYLANLSGSLVPSVVGAVQAAGDSTMRDASTVGEKLRSRTPRLADALPTRTDQLGQPAKRFGPGLQNLLSPIRTSPDRVTGNPILEEIQATGAVIPALGKHKDETPQAYQVRATVIGKRVQQAVTDLLAAPEYRALPPEQRKEVLEDRVRAVRARAAKYPAGVTP